MSREKRDSDSPGGILKLDVKYSNINFLYFICAITIPTPWEETINILVWWFKWFAHIQTK